MPPFTQIVRRNSSGARQSLVTNVDTAMLSMGLDGDFNLRRLERYLAMVKPAGIWPIVILTKRDLCDDVETRLDALRERLPHDIAVHAVDARAATTAIELAPYIGAGQTTVVLGSSGAGKSTLTNTLLGGTRTGHRRRARRRQPRPTYDDFALAASIAHRRLRDRHAGIARTTAGYR